MNKFGKYFLLLNAITLICVTLSRSEAFARRGEAGNFYLEGAFLPVWTTHNQYWSPSGGAMPGEADPGKESVTGYDARAILGYAFGGRFLVGFSYNMYSAATKRDGIEPKEGSTTITEYGPALGFLYGGWKFIASYVMASEWKYTMKYQNSTGTTVADQTYTNKEGSGFLVNFGYNITIKPWLQLGPSLIYRSVEYSKGSLEDRLNPGNSYTDQSFSTKPIQSELQPYFSIIARF